MKTLLSKNLRYFLAYTTLILIGCFPLLYLSMHYFYTKDLDKLILYRADDFITATLPEFTDQEIPIWNKYNEDIQIQPFDPEKPLLKYLREPYYNRAEGHPVDYRVIYTRIEIQEIPYLLMSRIPMIEAEDLLGMLISQYAVLFILLILLLGVIQRNIARKLWVPFYDTLNKIETFRLEKGNQPIFAPTDTEEFTRLNRLVKEMITNNLDTYNRQKEFIENASHELQTPLAVFQSQLDMLLQQPGLTAPQVEIIQSLYTVSSRLTRLNKNLLLLAKIDNAQFKNTEKTNIRTLLQNQLALLTPMIESNQLTLQTSLISELTTHANPILLESLINNLITNAIRHNQPGGTIRLELIQNQLLISNTGTDQPLNPEKIFHRFSRTTEQRKGNGLGLAICQAICCFHNWQVKYEYQQPYHIFRVSFPGIFPEYKN